MNKISLTASMRSNLLSLQNISRQVDSTQNKLSTGNKVNSAIDNPSSYYAARSLNNRAGDLDALLDSMGQAVSTIKAATTALEAGASFLEQAAAVATQVLEGTGGVGGGSGTGSNGGTEGPGGGDKPSPEPIYIPQASGISDSASIRNTSLFDGRANTKAMIDQIGADALAATACNQFYAPGVDKDDANFGQGQWYLPAVGELMEMYGLDAAEMTNGYGASGSNNDNMYKINDALFAINAFCDTEEVGGGNAYWSSSRNLGGDSWDFIVSDGRRSSDHTNRSAHATRGFLFLENKFNPKDAASAPKIGDVMYSDITYGSADDYDGSKTAVGIVNWVSEDSKSAKILSLKDLKIDESGVFNPDAPYTGSNPQHTTDAKWLENIITIENYDADKLLAAFQEAVAESAAKTPAVAMALADDVPIEAVKYDSSQYQNILSQYDSLIKDASYKGVNLLQQQDLKVTFNESRTSSLNVVGKDASVAALGLTTTEWNTIQDIAQSLKEISSALNQIRSMSSELGSYYNIVTTRQDFTEKLINVLEEGADKLTLADMNEESANMLALQTRQQLAVNSLSLASQAAQSILKLF